MKKTFFTASIVLFIAINCFSQASEKSNYLQKSKYQKITAWVFLGAGAVVDIIGFATYPYDILLTPSQQQQEKTSLWLIASGSACMLASIPFFITSHKNKKKAMSISFKNEMAQQLTKNCYAYKPVPSLSLKIKL